VAGSLPYALAAAGARVRVFMPLYKGIQPQKLYPGFGHSRKGKVEFIFVRADGYFLRDGLYGGPFGDFPDNMERYAYFCRRVPEILKEQGWQTDIIHANDWQTALLSVYLKAWYAQDHFFKDTAAVLTIHNIAYQGIFEKEKYPALGLSWRHFNMHEMEFYNHINLLKGGIAASDAVNTVSPTYAKEIQVSDYGWQLDPVLRANRLKLWGILNGVDYKVWAPRRDRFIHKKYSADDLAAKAANKAALQKECGLKPDGKAFLLGMVSRLVDDKGLDILSEAMAYLLKRYQMVVLGSGDSHNHKMLHYFKQKYPRALSAHIKFDEALAHRIYAASDAFLIPSLTEPCGLSQLIAYKYGAAPITHLTGGLSDTVTDVSRGGSGFVFSQYASENLIDTVDRAYRFYCDKKNWSGLGRAMMAYDFSWKRAASRYMEMYNSVKRPKTTDQRL